MVEIILFLTLLVFSIYCIKKALQPFNFDYKSYFLNGTINHNEIKTLERGDCVINFTSEKFTIKQNEKIIEDNVADIYHFRLWTYENGLYLAITTKTHNEYKFSLVNPDDDKNDIAKTVHFKIISGIAKRLKVELVEE